MAISGLGLSRKALSVFLKSNVVMLSHALDLSSDSHGAMVNWRLELGLESFLALIERTKDGSIGAQESHKALTQGFQIADVLRGRAVQNAL